MNIINLFQPSRWRVGLDEATSLKSWRIWFANVMIVFGALAMPLSMVATFAIYIAEKQYGLITFDVGIWLFLIIMLITKGGSYRFRAYFLLVVLYSMTITFYIALGPHYARSAWLVMCAVMATLMFGSRAAAVSTATNAAMLMLLYWLMGPENQAWASTYAMPFGKWVMFVINISIITLTTSLPVGFLLNRLDRALNNERNAFEKLTTESKMLQSAHIELQSEVAERKRAEEDLKEAYDIISRSPAVAFLWKNEEGWPVEFVTDNVETIFGYTTEEFILGKVVYRKTIHPDDLDRVEEEIQVFSKEKDREGFVHEPYRIVTKDGKEKWVEDKTFIRRDKTGRITHYQGIVEDITDRMKAEKALHQEQEKFRILVEESPFGISFIDEDDRYKYINPKFIEIFGYNLEDIPEGREWFKKAYPDSEYRRKVILSWINDLKKSEVGVGRPRSFNVRCKDGSEKVIYFRSVTMETGEQFIIYEDITEQKQLEAQYQQAQKMEAVGTLAGGIAHDFNNLLQSILGYSQLLLFEKKREDPEFDKLKEIEKAAQRASELTLQLLTFSRKIESELRPVNLNHQVEYVHKLLKRTIPKMIDIELHLEENLKITNADPAQIEQVLMNLAVNARDAIHDEGKLIIETENVTLDEEYCKTHLGTYPREHVLLIVSDTGCGMDRESTEHIFEPFYTTKGPGKGTGLGLSMVYGIVNSHGGYITCYSEPGKGTIFKIYLPVIGAEIVEQVAERKEEAMPTGGREAILLVDDEEFIRNLGDEILSKFGYKILTAPDGESALTLYQEKKESISLIILDLIMPGMGGRRCLEELMNMNPQVKVVIASGYSVNGPAKEALEAGAKGFIEKPYNIKQMLKIVRKVLDEN